MSRFQFSRLLEMARNLKRFLNPESGFARGGIPDNGGRRERAPKSDTAVVRIEEQHQMLKNEEQEIARSNARFSAERGSARSDRERRRASWAARGSEVGGLPDFIIIGAQKCGTSFLYRSICRHPYARLAAVKEVQYFTLHFDKGVDWYRSHFLSPTRKKGRRLITGEASPYYLYHPHAAKRAVTVVPNVKLIVLLRNPVDRAYSDYHHQRRLGNETLSFVEAIEAEQDRLQGEVDRLLADESYISLKHRRFSYLSRGIYVNQLQEWHRFFGRDQVLVLNSEDLFGQTRDVLKLVLGFLGLPEWQPEPSKLSKPNKEYAYARMDPAIRQRLSEHFEPHNQRLYEYLGTDLGW